MSMTPSEIRDLTIDEIEDELDSAREEYMRMRFQRSTGELTDYNRLRATRRTIARLMTIMNEKRLNGEELEEGAE